ncbi:hypothetical protein J8273_8792 [Carpediemonas membranifera]|uniref:Kinesin motor domain-containing protein n=1 Tax=Carpediemonas membranifera TaxID=201153 RepID=A0A8J6E6F2_9EUKA|nr:hypothetical protein J8273_8792 [Carpediemonas membranifera]|eukprot:KAG9389500.1 hypothetical protein J8273_8792 [Carpediemonas membranifera]
MTKQKISVSVRFRPLLPTEAKHKTVEGVPDSEDRPADSFSLSTGKKLSVGPFERVFTRHDRNGAVYREIVQPLVSGVLNLQISTAAFFAYGQTSAGKTHTMLGYGPERGMYDFAAQDVLTFIEPHPDLSLQIRFIELYNGKAFDLNNNHMECFVRTNAEGEIDIRANTEVDPETKQVKVNRLKTVTARTMEDVHAIMRNGIKQRAVGCSTRHNQSSRSHAVLELEIVSQDLIALRDEITQKEAELVPVGNKRDSYVIDNASKLYRQDEIGRWIKNDDPEMDAIMAANDAEVAHFQARVDAAVAAEKGYMASHGQGLLGRRIILVDLAGADTELRTGKMDPAEQKESREINKSLLALKECFRALASGASHVPYRNSMLTHTLKRFLGDDRVRVGMLANASPSAEHAAMTVNTMRYANLVATSVK